MARGQAVTTYGSLFTGVGGFDLGCDSAGWQCAFQVEWDKKASSAGVRRLTPRECERLQGWPDDHTRWAVDGKENADGPRYKMIGNGVAAPVAQWIAERIEQAL